MAEHDEDRGNRTEEATPRRRQEAREKGQVALSVELVAAVLLTGWLGALAFGGGALARALGASLVRSIQELPARAAGDLSAREAAGLAVGLAGSAALPLAVLVLPLVLLALAVGYGQVGLVVATSAVQPELSRIDPARGLRRLFGARSAFRVGLALAKLTGIAVAIAVTAWLSVPKVAALASAEVGPALAGIGHVALRSSAAGLAVALAFGLADLLYQRFQHERDLRMTRAEVREDLRASEGDPLVRARVRRVQRELARRRMLDEVPKATVVVTNPTHYSVALNYERVQDEGPGEARRAPRVVAKGVDDAALRIREIARAAGVPVRESPPLARALHARCAVGDEIPADLYRAVAAVLAYVYRVRGELERAS